VALTRAEDCLCVCGYKKKNKPNEESWYEIFKEAFAKLGISQIKGGMIYNIEQQTEIESVETAENKKTQGNREWQTSRKSST
jgi:ATP-dependent exoDNAse (exonuclease V) beta subunit